MVWLRRDACFVVFFSSRRRHTRCLSDWSSDVCSSDLRICGWSKRAVPVTPTGDLSPRLAEPQTSPGVKPSLRDSTGVGCGRASGGGESTALHGRECVLDDSGTLLDREDLVAGNTG